MIFQNESELREEFGFEVSGGPEEDRVLDLRAANAALRREAAYTSQQRAHASFHIAPFSVS